MTLPPDFGPTGVGAEVACTGCGTPVTLTQSLGLRCPLADSDDGQDHALYRFLDGPRLCFPESLDRNPFVRYRTLFTTYHVARQLGLPDEDYVELVAGLSRRAADLLGEPLLMADVAEVPVDSADLALPVRRLEATNAVLPWATRGLFGILVHLAALEAVGQRAAVAARARPLVCLGDPDTIRVAVILAQLSGRPMSVVVPDPCPAAVMAFLRAARVEPLVADGPSPAACRARFHRALRDGALPFTPYGAHALPAREGLATLAYDIAEALHARGESLAMMVVPATGGALPSALVTGYSEAFLVGGAGTLPRLIVLEGEGEGALIHAMDRLDDRMGRVCEPDPNVYVPALRDAARDPDAYLDPGPDTTADDDDLDDDLDDEDTRAWDANPGQPWATRPPDWLACLDGVVRTRGAIMALDMEEVDPDDPEDDGADAEPADGTRSGGGATAQDDSDVAARAAALALRAMAGLPDDQPLLTEIDNGVVLVVT
ncbi:hypothetical protein [Roseospira visakhapatnamensis]|uniref:Pyridoxal-phosphate dependent enzyme n=1 Tax=Roseospira visakhapatnamensis TaxID=390880 RepID=A0A7W6RCF1_9PROT|nr:hypothetical protein [Roseospira visakhapatnamensis]MBB4265378.1 hypothetical protein [Roseospira visakhapatnamensis]